MRETPNEPVTTYTAAHVRALRRHLKATRGWSTTRFAKEIGYSKAYVKSLESGRLRASSSAITELKRLERDAAFLAKEIAQTDSETLDWLLTALEQRAGQIKGNALRRVKQLVQ